MALAGRLAGGAAAHEFGPKNGRQVFFLD